MTLLSGRMSILRDGRKIVREGKGYIKETEKQLGKGRERRQKSKGKQA